MGEMSDMPFDHSERTTRIEKLLSDKDWAAIDEYISDDPDRAREVYRIQKDCLLSKHFLLKKTLFQFANSKS